MVSNEESSILSALRHYWNQKGIISDFAMQRALSSFSNNQNPFLYQELQKELEKNIKIKKLSNKLNYKKLRLYEIKEV